MADAPLPDPSGLQVAFNGVSFRLTPESERVLDRFGEIPEAVSRRVTSTVLRKTERAVRTSVTKLVRARYNTGLTAKDFKEKIEVKPTTFGSAIRFEYERPTLRRYSSAETPRGVRFRILKGRARTWRGAFFPQASRIPETVPAVRGRYVGKRLVLTPKGATGREARRITAIRAISLSGMVAHKEVSEPTMRRAREVWAATFDYEFNRQMAKLGAKKG